MKFKEFLLKKGISDAQFKEMEASEQAKLHGEFLDELAKSIENAPKSEELTTIKQSIEDLRTSLVDKTKFEENVQKLEDLMLDFDAFKNKGGKNENKTFLEEVNENKSQIISMVKGSLGEKEITIKADTVRASITNNTDAVRLSGISPLARKARSLYDIFRKKQINKGDHNGQVRYHDWDEATTVKAAAMVAEGGTFPESTAKFVEYKKDLKKIGDTLPVSEEFGEDEVSAAMELERFVELNVESVVDTQLAVGDGTGNNIEGLYTAATTYTAAASGITDANIYDLAKKIRTSIVKNRGSKYKPDFVAMNADTYDRLVLKKDANNNYIFPDRENIGSMVIVEDNNLADNTLVVGDSRYGEIYERGGVVLSRVYVNAQGIEDMVTIKARKRLLFLIRNSDKTGFAKCANITTALATLAS